MAVLLLIALAIIIATGALAGDEEKGTLDLVLAQPVARTTLVLSKTAVLAAAVAVATLAIVPGFALARLFTEIEISVARMLVTAVGLVPLVWLFLALSLWAGATLPSRGAAVAAIVGVVAVAFFVNVMGAMVDVLDGPRRLSPFYWADPAHTLLYGFDWLRAAALLMVAAFFLAMAVVSFRGRDLSVGARSWREALNAATRRARKRAGETPPRWPSGTSSPRPGERPV